MNWHYHQIIKTTTAHIFLLCLFILSFCVSSNVGKAVVAHRKNITCIGQERDALLKFKHHIQRDYCGLMSSWGNPNKPDCCTWKGVTCSNQSGHVIGLNLSVAPYGYCLYCEDFSPSLSELKHLKYLDLSSNDFYGMDIPTSIGSLVNLIHLNLAGSYFGGNIPNHLGNLTSLTSLDLSSNEGLSAKSLKWISQLTLLRDINLSGIDLSDAADWTQSIGSLPLLEVLQMDDCQLSTPLTTPSLLSPNLRIVSLTRNNLTSCSVFQWLFNRSNYSSHKQSLEYLDMSGNFIQGPIPDVIGSSEFLKYLDLSRNSLSSIPDVIGDLKYLEYLDLSRNSLSSKIPDAIGDLKLLEYLDLSQNSLPSKILDAIGNLQSLIHMDLSNNSLSGPIPPTLVASDALGTTYSLLYLDLSNNRLEGAIPSAIGYSHSISHIDLSNNQLQGSIPSSFSKLATLSHLDLSNNHLEGSIPATIGNMAYLVYLDLSSNNLSGHIPCKFENIPSYANFSYNNLSGSLPIDLTYYMAFQGNPNLRTVDFMEICGETGILSSEPHVGGDNIFPGLYVSIGIGFYTGFWVFCGTLTVKNSWRHAYFGFIDHIIDNIYVIVAVYLAKFQRNT